jgi:signal transduction histidine kinase
MVGGRGGVYGDDVNPDPAPGVTPDVAQGMTPDMSPGAAPGMSQGASAARPGRRGGAAKAVLRAAAMTVLGPLWSARAWRATAHALAGLPIAAGAAVVFGGLAVVWWSAVWSLIEGPTGDWILAVLYAVFAVIAPVPLLASVREFSALQRTRFRALLGIEIPAPPRAAGGWWTRLTRLWGTPLWRQLGYHLAFVVIGAVGGALVAVCWTAPALAVGYLSRGGPAPGLTVAAALGLFVAAPWAARGVMCVDEAAARRLLGPTRSERLARRVESLARSRADIVAATDAERRRIERDLHDGTQQRLVSLAMNLGMARARLDDTSGPAREAIEAAHDEATQALTELRELVRGLHPPVLGDRGLDAALSGIAARAPIPVRLRVDVEPRCAPSVEAVAYFVVSEALTNVAKHARAEHAEVSVERTGDRLHIVVTDDGVGGARLETDPDQGSGLRGLAQRAAAVDGALTLHSPPGGPTTITVELPCES